MELVVYFEMMSTSSSWIDGATYLPRKDQSVTLLECAGSMWLFLISWAESFLTPIWRSISVRSSALPSCARYLFFSLKAERKEPTSKKTEERILDNLAAPSLLCS